MAQERVGDMFEWAKDLARAEKELEVQNWVIISIYRTDQHGNETLLFRYDLPRELYLRRVWVINWRMARYTCQYPKDRIYQICSFYDKRLGTDHKLNEDLKTLASAKAQVTKVKREIDRYINHQRANNLFFDEATDELLLKTKAKLAVKEANVKAAEERMRAKIKQIKNLQ